MHLAPAFEVPSMSRQLKTGDWSGIAILLHAAVQEIRCQIMAAALAIPIKIFIEYIMLDGMNDEKQHAHQHGKLLEIFQVPVMKTKLQASKKFYKTLMAIEQQFARK